MVTRGLSHEVRNISVFGAGSANRSPRRQVESGKNLGRKENRSAKIKIDLVAIEANGMAKKLCAPFPLMDLPIGVLQKHKMQRCSPLLDFTPESLRPRMSKILNDAGVCELKELFEMCKAYEDSSCAHAALAGILEPAMANMFASAFLLTPEEDHDVILAMLSICEDCEPLYHFLAQIEIDGLERAVTEALERTEMPAFPGANIARGGNEDPNAVFIRNFLLKILGKQEPVRVDNMTSRILLLSMKWLPYFASTRAECISLIHKHLEHPDTQVRCIAALHLSALCPNNIETNAELWKQFEAYELQAGYWLSMEEGSGHIEKMIAGALLQRASRQHASLDLAGKSDEFADYWRRQMDVTEPANRTVVEHALCTLYESVFCPPPQAVIWFENPRLAAVAAAIFARVTIPDFKRRAGVESISRVALYIEKLKRRIQRFPEVASRSKRAWEFGLTSYVPEPEYDPFPIRCGTAMLRSRPERARDTWDFISTRANARMNREVAIAWERMTAALAGTQEAWMFEMYNKSSLRLPKVQLFFQGLLDRDRLGAVGYRSLLESLDVCPKRNDGLDEILRSCGGFIPFENVVIALERPCKITRDQRNRLHNGSGKSIEYPDGWGCYSLHGMSVKKSHIITHPEKITIEEINTEYNVEIRRVMIERYGIERFIHDSQAEVIHEDEFGALYRKNFRGHDAMAMVKVINRTPEADGSFKSYFLDVPPHMRTARQAVAWTFGLPEREYAPEIET